MTDTTLRQALAELVALQDMKASLDAGNLVVAGMPFVDAHDDYRRRKPLAWEAARAALANRQPIPQLPAVALESVELIRDVYGMCIVKVNGREAIRDNGDVISHHAKLDWFAASAPHPPAAKGEPAIDRLPQNATWEQAKSAYLADHARPSEQPAAAQPGAEPPIPPMGSPLQKLGARLTMILGEDHWAEIEPMLFACAAPEEPSLRAAPLCQECGKPQSLNPHLKAGDPSLEFGYQWQCIPCLVRSRSSWASRCHAAERERDHLAARPPAIEPAELPSVVPDEPDNIGPEEFALFEVWQRSVDDIEKRSSWLAWHARARVARAASTGER